ncbi:MAG: putative transporter ATP-binding protein YbbA [Pseudomonadota bacterium]
MSTPLLRAHELCKSVPVENTTLHILKDVNVHLESGETLAIVGASGSGKTTLLGLLAGLDRASSGEVFWDTQALSALSEEQLAAYRKTHIGFVFQSFQLLPSLTALENVMLPLQLAGKSNARAQAKLWLDKVGLGARLEHTPKQLSGGEQQRVAIARAFVNEPKLLFADEPTGNLDSSTCEAINELMFALNRSSGTTLVLVTHDLTLAAQCGQQLRLHGGQITAHTRTNYA